MCGRYALAHDSAELAEWFKAEPVAWPDRIDESGRIDGSGLSPRFNIAPTTTSYIVVEEQAGRTLEVGRWGLIPAWSKDVSRAHRMFNARSETAADKPAFRSAFRRRRCLVPADGYYEWQARTRAGKPVKQPFYIHAADDQVLSLAGLYEDWSSPQGPLRTFTIMTQESRGAMADIHDRMPVLIDRESWSSWLDPHTPEADVQALVQSRLCADDLECHPVSTDVNKVTNDYPNLVAPIQLPHQ
jgi:putative SOS response-associated peptidase YedK